LLAVRIYSVLTHQGSTKGGWALESITMSTPRSRRIPQSMSIRFAHDKTVTPARTKRDDHAVALQHCCQDPADEHVRFTQTDKRTVKKIRSCLIAPTSARNR